MDILKENVIPREKKNRLRGDNWAQDEKDIFMEIMQQSAPIIECKLTDTNSNKKKNLEWLKVQNKLTELTGKCREITQLKGYWRRSKLSAKKSVSQHRRALQCTGGGQRPPSPTADELKIKELCPIDFVVDENKYDSDAVSQFTEDNNISLIIEMDEEQDTTKYDKDLVENATNKMDYSIINDLEEVPNTYYEDEVIASNKKITDGGNQFFTPKSKPKKYQKNGINKAAILQSNLEFKNHSMVFMQEEYKLKMEYHKQEICHQQLKHKLEIDLLLLEKEKKLLEIKILKKSLE